jgi:hypothetical protein
MELQILKRNASRTQETDWGRLFPIQSNIIEISVYCALSMLYTTVYPKVSGLSRQRTIGLQQQTLVEKQHKGLLRQNSLD